MKNSRKFKVWRAFSAALVSLTAWATGLPAFAEWTAQRVIAGLEVATQASPGVASFYFRAANGWGASGCPSAEWAYIINNRDGAKEALAVMMQAKQVGSTVWLWGECNNGYFVIEGVYVVN
jgi:hypothetical protein